MRLDHIAYRVKDRHETANFFGSCLGYKIGTEFQIEFDDGSTADCLVLAPPEGRHPDTSMWEYNALMGTSGAPGTVRANFHAPPEIFISDGPKGSIVGIHVVELTYFFDDLRPFENPENPCRPHFWRFQTF